jgi:hypothetical protein
MNEDIDCQIVEILEGVDFPPMKEKRSQPKVSKFVGNTNSMARNDLYEWWVITFPTHNLLSHMRSQH